MDPIDLSKDLPFHPSLWIGVGKKFSDSLPQEVLNAHKEILEIPETFRNSLPPPTIHVRDFIHLKLPFQSGGLTFHTTAEWFSHDNSDTNPNILLT